MEEGKVKPFSNGTEFMAWYENNCAKCTKSNFEATERDKTCPMEYDVSFASVTDGEIPISSFNRISPIEEPCREKISC